MDKLLEELNAILAEELTIHAELVKNAQEMNTALKIKDLAKVQRFTTQFDVCIAQVEMLETRRLEACDALTRLLSPKNKHLNLQSIISLIPGEKRIPLVKIHTALKENINALIKLNTANQILLNESLVAISKNFEIIVQEQDKHSGYKRSGAKDTKSIRRSIVNHIA